MNAPHRLNDREVRAILESVFGQVDHGQVIAIHLYGSRADPAKKGGDLDLWIELRDAPPDTLSLSRTIRFGIEDRIGEQKIDLKITGPSESIDDAATRAFIESIERKAVRLWPS